MPTATPLSALPIRRLTMNDLMSCADLSEDRGWAREERRWGLLLTAGTGYGIDDPEGRGLAAVCVITSYGSAYSTSHRSYGYGSYGSPSGSSYGSRSGSETSRLGAHGAPGDRGLATIGMMLVAGRHARQGLGRRMMTHVLHEAGDTPLILNATEYGLPLYQQLGFTSIGVTETVLGHFKTPEPVPSRARVMTRPATADDLSAIVRLDTEIFGVDRTHLIVRLPAFADHLRVAEDSSGLIGYAAAWPTPAADVIGPLIARDTGTAKALVSSLTAGIADSCRRLRIVIDIRHEELLAWVKDHGLEPTTRTTTMVHGIPDQPGDWTWRFAPLNLATG
ncbi:GNAT family N-acetyltransferase [Streptomyces sp. GMY02]|uniref:GNAT family N-acetyltransferase n=1 Tax=Streptomyces sp. GMY02 TaxID=1333528 RepID=UPI001C2B80F4|nr:GNAT family N-acetyltransferase [Streptomyces sp. GMY02]QXE35845.1 GNAT family N-acetyltransferase [Streptomyces sp. GMY02]